MRILFTNNLCGFFGGVEQIVADYSKALASRGHDCFLAYGQYARNEMDYEVLFQGTFQCNEIGDGDQGYSFSEIIQTAKPDVVFVHKVSHLPSDFEQHTSFRKVLMVHDHDLWCPKGTGYYSVSRRTCRVAAGLPCYLDGAFLQRKESGLLPIKWQSIPAKRKEMSRNHHFDTILVLSEYLKKQLLLNGFPLNRLEIHNPVVNLPVPFPQPLPEEPVVLFVGSLIRGKGVDFLLRAMAQVDCPFRLNIVGSGESEPELLALAKELQLQDRTDFVGWVAHDELLTYYQAARVVTVPSCWPEPFGLIGQEAMRCARPVVAFEVGGIPDWCEDGVNGFTISEQDTTAFARAIERLLTDYELAKKMGVNGLSKANADFSFSASIDKLESLLMPD